MAEDEDLPPEYGQIKATFLDRQPVPDPMPMLTTGRGGWHRCEKGHVFAASGPMPCVVKRCAGTLTPCAAPVPGSPEVGKIGRKGRRRSDFGGTDPE